MQLKTRTTDVFLGQGEMATLMRGTDWAQTPLGPIEAWPEALKTAVRILLTSKFDMWLGWGKDITFLYNDAYRPTLGAKHPAALGMPTQVLWAEIWPDIAPLIAQVYEQGEATWSEALLLLLARNGYLEETYHTFSYSPIFDGDGSVGGLLCAVVEETTRVINSRRLESLRILATELTRSQTLQDVFGAAQAVLGGNGRDIPFSLTYLFDDGAASLVASTGFAGAQPPAPPRQALGAPDGWPLDHNGAIIALDEKAGWPTGAWAQPPTQALVVALQGQGEDEAHGAIVVGLNPHLLPGDDDYLGYLKLLAGQVAAGLASAEAYDAARRRAAALAEAVALREEAEAALRQVNTQLETEVAARTVERDHLLDLFHRAPGFMCVLRGPDHIFEFMNEAYLQLIGHRELTGRPMRDALPEVAGQGYLELLDEVYRSGQPFVGRKLETNLQRVPGAALEKRFLNLVYQPIYDDGAITRIFVEGHDITDQVRGEQALRELNAELERKIIERTQARGRTWQITPDLLGALNARGYFETSNPAWQTLLGWTEDEVAAQSLFELLHPGDVEAARRAFALTQQGQPAIRVASRYRCKGGGYRWISWTGVPEDGMVYCSGRDITEEVAAQKERDQLWTLSEDLLARGDYDGNLLAVNPAWTKVLGWSRDKLLGDPYLDIIHPDNARTVVATLAEMRRSGQPTRFENRILAADGGWTPVGWTVSPEPGGEHFIAIGRDLREDKARERELLDAQEALRQAQKMEAVGQLTGGIAHDFNNLLAGISGSLELLELRLGRGETDRLERYIHNAQDAARRAAALTQRLLAFSRRQTLDPKATNINGLINGMEDLIRRTVGPEIEVEVVGAGGLWLCLVDISQLENALLNLAINARDAMAGAGRLTIETANKWLDDRAGKERDLPPGQYVSLCVTDTGTGMSADVIAQAFDPFFTTKPLGQGTGLGLSMIHGFVRQSGGQVRIYSELGKGTTMCLYFPRFLGAIDGTDDTEEPGAPEDGQGETIMVIDDEQSIRMLLVEVLEESGYTVIQAADGPSGLEVLRSDRRIDLLITDVGLPGGLNGRQVADAARVSRPSLRILFITGYAENAAVGNGMLDQGMEVITKPFAVNLLGNKVRDMLDRPAVRG